MNIDATDARPEWVDFMVRALANWRPRAVAAGKHALVALTDCVSQTRDKRELECVLYLYIEEFLGRLPNFSRYDDTGG
jgi:hypothetical protein